MRRRGTEAAVAPPELPKKKCRLAPLEAPSDLDASFCDDEALPPGLVMTDIAQQKWRIGKPIGRGSFGRIYLASNDVDTEVTKQNARYVVKIEPHTNGPLFVEIHCLIRSAKISKVKQWRTEHKQKSLGMPLYIASGSFTDESTGIRYRFLVLPRYEVDLQKIIARKGRVLDLKNVLILAIQILDVLEFLHNEGYTHSDIKSSNLMLGFDGMKFGKMPTNPSTFLKEVHRATTLKQKVKQNRPSNYYNDEDFVVQSNKSDHEIPVIKERKMVNVTKKMRKILSDRASRNLHRYHAFNLRQLSNQVNYEDFNSSICSDESYQRLLDEQEKYSSDEGFQDCPKYKFPDTAFETDTFSEAVLSQSNGQIYLLDYGLASKFLDSNGEHKEFGMDARKAHDGTLEYSSRDSHIGAHSRRSDFETLGFNVLDWLTGTLPWKTTEMLAEPDLVHALKKNYMGDVKALLRTCFKTEFYPEFMEKYLEYVTSLEFTQKPDYDYCRNIFKTEFMRNNFGNEKHMRLCLNEAHISPLNRKKLSYVKRFGRPMKNTPSDFISRNGIKKIYYGRENRQSLENDLKLELLKRTLNTSSNGIRTPCGSRNFFISEADLVAKLKKSLLPLENLGKKLSPKNLRSKKRLIQKKRGRRAKNNSMGKFGNFLGSGRQYSWAEILAGKPEHMVKAVRKDKSDDEDDSNKSRNRKVSNASETLMHLELNNQSPLQQKDYLKGLNPTYAMKEVFTNFRKKSSKKAKDQQEIEDQSLEGYTPAMVKVLRAKEKREAKERAQELKEKQFLAKKAAADNVLATKAKKVPKKPVGQSRKRESAKKSAMVKLADNKKTVIKKQATVVVTPVKRNARMTRSDATAKKNTIDSKRKPIVRIESIPDFVNQVTKREMRTPKKSARQESAAKSVIVSGPSKKTSSATGVTPDIRITRSSRRARK